MLATTCWENLGCKSVLMVDGVSVCPGGVLVVSQLCFGGGGWCLSGILWWCVRNVLTVFGDVLGLAHVLVVFLWCVGGAPAGVLVALKEWHLFD